MRVLRIAAPVEADAALDALIAAGAVAVEVQGVDLLGLFAAGAAPVLDPVFGAREEEAVLVDWGSVWAASLRPVRVGPLLLVPEGSAGKSGTAGGGEAGALVLEVGPAFGSALHPTTALCLEWLVERSTAGSVLDVGTGSGVLALAALRLGAARAFGTETEAAALAVAARNAARSGLAGRLELGLRPPDGARYDRVVANLLAGPLIAMAHELASSLAPGGELAVSGLGPSMEPEVARALRHVGLRLTGRAERDGWCRLDAVAGW